MSATQTPMTYRKLRIAWSVVWGMVAVVLVVCVVLARHELPGPLYIGHIENELLPDGSVSRYSVDEIIPFPNGEIVPTWILVAIPATFAGLAWLPARRFSLRTL